MNTRNESRSSNVRENNMREDQWTFEEPDALALPDSVRAMFDAEGMAYRWIRLSVRGVDDVLNIGKRLQEGWILVQSDEVPELAISSSVRDEGRYQGAVCRGDLALAKMPAGRVKAKRKFYEDKANDMMDAVNSQLMKSSDSRMPITNSSRSVTTRGRQPSFQD